MDLVADLFRRDTRFTEKSIRMPDVYLLMLSELPCQVLIAAVELIMIPTYLLDSETHCHAIHPGAMSIGRDRVGHDKMSAC